VVIEAEENIGGGARSGELTLPGYIHDLGSAIHPLGAASPFFNSLPLGEYGLEWVYPNAALAHPLDGAIAAVLDRSVEETGRRLGADAAAYRRLMGPLVAAWDEISPVLQGPIGVPRHPIALARFGVLAIRPATMLARSLFVEERARALLAGNGAHSLLALEQPITGAFALTLAALGHTVGWPFPRGGGRI
jgi:phytoene dehydrogenase-like protein